MSPVPLAKGKKPEKVKVLDNFYNPTTSRSRRTARSSGSGATDFNSHNVTLKKGPKGVKKSKFTSQTSSDKGFTFTKKFKKPGKYNFYCTIHPDIMKMKVMVKR